MRISDWSSDVCSSDLNLPARARGARGLHEVHIALHLLGEGVVGVEGRDVDVEREHAVTEPPPCRLAEGAGGARSTERTGHHLNQAVQAGPLVVAASAERTRAVAREMGRAACRETVCPSGKISVAGVPLIKHYYTVTQINSET